jgi:hypothetical protein
MRLCNKTTLFQEMVGTAHPTFHFATSLFITEVQYDNVWLSAFLKI